MSQRATERLYTSAEFEMMPEFNERYELLNGRLVEKPMVKYEHGDIVWFIQKAYDRFDPDEKIGALRPEISVFIRPDYYPAPDLSFWLAARKPKRNTKTAPYPDLAIEVQSPDQSLPKLRAKAHEYISGGVQMVWIIQPAKKIVLVYRQGQPQPVTVAPTGELTAGDVIPGFKIKLEDLFGSV